jgi:hypothetical protein
MNHVIAGLRVIFFNYLVTARTLHGTFALAPLLKLLVWSLFAAHSSMPISLTAMTEAMAAVWTLYHGIRCVLRQIHEEIAFEAFHTLTEDCTIKKTAKSRIFVSAKNTFSNFRPNGIKTSHMVHWTLKGEHARVTEC